MYRYCEGKNRGESKQHHRSNFEEFPRGDQSVCVRVWIHNRFYLQQPSVKNMAEQTEHKNSLESTFWVYKKKQATVAKVINCTDKNDFDDKCEVLKRVVKSVDENAYFHPATRTWRLKSPSFYKTKTKIMELLDAIYHSK
jgi:hypothetical protein